MRAIIMHLADTPLCLNFSHSGPIKGECPEGHWAFDRRISITESHISLSRFQENLWEPICIWLARHGAGSSSPPVTCSAAALSLSLWFSRSSFSFVPAWLSGFQICKKKLELTFFLEGKNALFALVLSCSLFSNKRDASVSGASLKFIKFTCPKCRANSI